MNNLSFGGIDPRTGEAFAYYETIGGGMGARPTADGLSGVHTHMTNSLNTPIEALETGYPVRVRRYSLRRDSGGKGRFRGGDGIIREIEFLTDVRASILSERRRFQPYGLAGGRPGEAGRNELIVPEKRKSKSEIRNSTSQTRNSKFEIRNSEFAKLRSRIRELPSKAAFNAPEGSILRIATPGGGGWGKKRSQKSGVRLED
jgi:N-methylhydantoinase B